MLQKRHKSGSRSGRVIQTNGVPIRCPQVRNAVYGGNDGSVVVCMKIFNVCLACYRHQVNNLSPNTYMYVPVAVLVSYLIY